MKDLFRSSSNMLLPGYTNEELKRENAILQELLNCFKRRGAVPSEIATDLTDLVSMQRKHIETLEVEFESVQTSYENALKGHVSSYQLNTNLETAKSKCRLLQETIDEINTRFGKEVAILKTKFVEQNAKLILGKDTPIQHKTPMINNSGMIRNELPIGKALSPLVNPKSFTYN